MNDISFLANIIGNIGAAIIIIAYFLIQSGKVSQQQIIYPSLNLIGAILLLISLTVHYNLPSVIIELFWIAISIYGIWKIKKRF